jgi:hypothetical protein
MVDYCAWQAFFLAVTLAAVMACVGSETGERTTSASASQESNTAAAPENERETGAVYVDTVTPARYQLFQTDTDSEVPKKVIYRMMVLERARLAALSKTMRLALDSLSRSDTSLVAARAILYVFLPTDRSSGRLVPVVWGEWVPPEGWDQGRTRTRERLHRSYIYSVDPGWYSEPTVEEE